jgi:D-glycerate 3-kinase
MLQPDSLVAFLNEHRLPASYDTMAHKYFVPLTDWLYGLRDAPACLLLGINGAQGAGKSTLADFIAFAANELYGWNVTALSLDDFYLTRAERSTLAAQRHPLFATRGVPGTHDTGLLKTSLAALRELGDGETYAAPRFDKSLDDRAQPPWPTTTGPVDMIILEGWCVGTPPQAAVELTDPVNTLEREQDSDRTWRKAVNAHLEDDYLEVFDLLDALVFLRAPSFDAIYEWRLEQETKLADKVGACAPGIMAAEEIRQFIAHYERLTRHNLRTLGDRADVIFELEPDHAVGSCRYKDRN